MLGQCQQQAANQVPVSEPIAQTSKLHSQEGVCRACWARALAFLLTRENQSHFSQHSYYSFLLGNCQEVPLTDVVPVLRDRECCIR